MLSLTSFCLLIFNLCLLYHLPYLSTVSTLSPALPPPLFLTSFHLLPYLLSPPFILNLRLHHHLQHPSTLICSISNNPPPLPPPDTSTLNFIPPTYLSIFSISPLFLDPSTFYLSTRDIHCVYYLPGSTSLFIHPPYLISTHTASRQPHRSTISSSLLRPLHLNHPLSPLLIPLHYSLTCLNLHPITPNPSLLENAS